MGLEDELAAGDVPHPFYIYSSWWLLLQVAVSNQFHAAQHQIENVNALSIITVLQRMQQNVNTVKGAMPQRDPAKVRTSPNLILSLKEYISFHSHN